jgi:hypothetical protein
MEKLLEEYYLLMKHCNLSLEDIKDMLIHERKALIKVLKTKIK